MHFETYAGFIHRLAGHLSDTDGHDVKYALVHSDPQLAEKPFAERARLCYLWDTKMVREADVVIAECSFPSIGLGIELQVAAETETPIILMYRDFSDNRADPANYRNPDGTEHELQIGDGFASLMAHGLPTVFKICRYSREQEGIAQASQATELLNQK